MSDTASTQLLNLMPELFPLQAELLKVVTENASGLLSKTCSMTSEELRKAMRIKPCSEQYISRILYALRDKEKIKISREQTKEGLKRVITVL